jgi:hypothetical protein
MHAASRLAAALTLLSVATASVPAQVGGFSDGDMILYSRTVTGSTSSDGGLVSIDPLTGDTELLVPFDLSSYRRGAAAFDAYRQRVIFSATFIDGGHQNGLWATDAAGEVQRLIDTTENMGSFCPTGDGNIYFLSPFDYNSPFKVLDAANRSHDILNEAGDAAFSFTGIFGHNDSVMAWDAATNALFVAYDGNQGPGCSGGASHGIILKKIPLTPDGMQVAGPVECTEFDVDAIQSTEIPVNISKGPNGSLMIVCDTTSLIDAMPRVVLVDPATLTVSTYAETGPYPGASQSTAGAYSSLRDEAVVLDTLGNVLRAFGQGDTGAGTVIAPSGPLSWDPGSGETATLLEIENGSCAGGFLPIGTGLRGTGALVPALVADGCASLGSGVDLAIRDVVGGASGALLMGLSGGEVPFRGGTLYLATVDLTWFLTLGGTPGAAGEGSLDIAFGTLTDPVFSGLEFLFQAGFLDAGAPKGVSLTQAVKIDID